ncbi:hypothetical protein PUNSTDRAFT_143245 [Punctularia strigosozonata HHB-11173 SS5]|uniref:uncharacterized protein n=1 Tax=Punctularia strigosozonata (strain HHB-11173) TaxID=741275 RepID=UPI000441723C|nr:uncharacterized protein PUNSTDRAFT_143245 [Punctularia strigosozonata HHB-11173 SS5]EIN09824.1 hypothetical protein PUNSTDRAFT_143245 [Punctularia strigosozonata HHB-11173 SS5]
MNTIWGLLDWIWPSSPIQLREDRQLSLATSLREYAPLRPAQLVRAPSTPSRARSQSSTAPNGTPSRTRTYSIKDRHDASVSRTSHRERRESYSSFSSWDQLERGEVDHERERERRLVENIKRHNAALLERVSSLEHDLSASRSQLASTQNDLSNISSTLTLSQSRATALEQALVDAHTSLHSLQSELLHLRTENAALLSSHSSTTTALEATTSELATLKSFLDKTDAWTGAQVVQAVKDLNNEIVQLGAAVSDEFAGTLDRKRQLWRAGDRDLVSASLGKTMAELLLTRDHKADPMLVGLALQAWEVHCCAQVFSAFCFGLPGDVDQFLHNLFAHMLKSESQAAACRWRSLTHAYTHSLLTSSSASPNHSPRHGHSRASLLDPETIITVHIRGILAILALAGCSAAPPTPSTSTHTLPSSSSSSTSNPAPLSLPSSQHPSLDRDYLRARFGGQLKQIVTRASTIATALREGIMSGTFDVVRVAKEGARFDPRAMADVFAPPPEMSRPSSPIKESPPALTPASVEEDGRVLCGVEFGLVCVSRRASPRSSPRAGSLAIDGEARENEHAGAHLRVDPDKAAPIHERSVLLKPKVLLQSVTDILDASEG